MAVTLDWDQGTPDQYEQAQYGAGLVSDLYVSGPIQTCNAFSCPGAQTIMCRGGQAAELISCQSLEREQFSPGLDVNNQEKHIEAQYWRNSFFCFITGMID